MPSWVEKKTLWAQAFGCTIEIQEIRLEKCKTMRLTLLMAEFLTCHLSIGARFRQERVLSWHRQKTGIDQFPHLSGHLFYLPPISNDTTNQRAHRKKLALAIGTATASAMRVWWKGLDR